MQTHIYTEVVAEKPSIPTISQLLFFFYAQLISDHQIAKRKISILILLLFLLLAARKLFIDCVLFSAVFCWILPPPPLLTDLFLINLVRDSLHSTNDSFFQCHQIGLIVSLLLTHIFVPQKRVHYVISRVTAN